MISLIIEIVLQALVAVSALAATASLIAAFAVRGGSKTSNYFWQSILSLIAGTAPYIGLFGTVWHIIAALSGIGGGNLSVSEIAKPIGEALIATLWGLGAAILALVAFRVAALIEHSKPDEGAEADESEAADE